MNSRQKVYRKFASVTALAAIVCLVIVLSSSFTAFAAGVNTADRRQVNITIAYMVTSAIAFALLVGYCAMTKKKEMMFILLFTAVFVIWGTPSVRHHPPLKKHCLQTKLHM